MTFRFVLPALLLLSSLPGVAGAENNEMSDAAISERIAPVGQVYLAGEATAAAETAPQVDTRGPREGATIYQTYCMACHASGVAGAPVTGDAAAWDGRKAKGMETLISNAINGFNAMPPRGTCMDCSDEEIEATISYMLDQ